MTGPSFIYFDLETRRTALEVGGWDKLKKMGVSVAAAFADKRLHVFGQKQIPHAVALLRSGATVVGYNIRRFDFEVLRGVSGVSLDRVRCFDLMEEIAGICSMRLPLSSLAAATLGIDLEPNGLAKIGLWKRGERLQVIQGCCNDVLAIKALHEHGCTHGHLFYFGPEAGKRRRIITPWQMKQTQPTTKI